MSDTTTTSLATHLGAVLPSAQHASLRDSVIPALLACTGQIAAGFRASTRVTAAGTANAFGDDQLNLDVLAEGLVRDALAGCRSVVTASSEEEPVEVAVQHTADAATAETGEEYTVAFDPLDGSSIIAPNWTVGAIFGVWEGGSALHQSPAGKQVASVLGVLGPRTTAFVALRVPGGEPTCFEVAITEAEGGNSFNYEVVRAGVRLDTPPFKSRYFAPANLRSAGEEEDDGAGQRYMDLLTYYIRERYNMRYAGGLVPDIVHALVKGHGVYVSPVTGRSKAKLRRLYELCPIALMLECCGGRAVDPRDGSRILDRPLEDIDERGGLVCGTAEEVEIVVQKLVKKQ